MGVLMALPPPPSSLGEQCWGCSAGCLEPWGLCTCTRTAQVPKLQGLCSPGWAVRGAH